MWFKEWLSKLSELEGEEIVDLMKKDSKKDQIRKKFMNIFLREPSDDEVDYIQKRAKSKEENPHKETQFENQTTEVADTYRYRHGTVFDLNKANKISNDLFSRKLKNKEIERIKELIEEPEPTKMTQLYRWIAKEVKGFMDNNKGLSVEEAYEEFVLRPPYPFEIKYFKKNLS